MNFRDAELIMGAPPGQEDRVYGLPVQKLIQDGSLIGWRSVWLPHDDERLFIQNGAAIDLRILSAVHPPVSVSTVAGTDVVAND